MTSCHVTVEPNQIGYCLWLMHYRIHRCSGSARSLRSTDGYETVIGARRAGEEYCAKLEHAPECFYSPQEPPSLLLQALAQLKNSYPRRASAMVEKRLGIEWYKEHCKKIAKCNTELDAHWTASRVRYARGPYIKTKRKVYVAGKRGFEMREGSRQLVVVRCDKHYEPSRLYDY